MVIWSENTGPWSQTNWNLHKENSTGINPKKLKNEFIYRLGLLVALFIATLTDLHRADRIRYWEYSKQEGFTNLSFSKTMIDAVNLNLDDENKKITGDLNEIRILFLNREKSNLGESLPKIMAGEVQKTELQNGRT